MKVKSVMSLPNALMFLCGCFEDVSINSMEDIQAKAIR